MLRIISNSQKERGACDYNRQRITKPLFPPFSVHAPLFFYTDRIESLIILYHPVSDKNNELPQKQMSNTEIINKINKCHIDLKKIQHMEENAVCEEFNVDNKEEIIILIMEELTDLLKEFEGKENLMEKEEEDFYEAIRLSYSDTKRQLLMNY